MLSKCEANDRKEKIDIQIDHIIQRKIVRIKRTGRSTQKKTRKKRINNEKSAGETAVPEKATADVLIAHTLSFDNENVYDKFSGGNLVRLVLIEKRKADQDSRDSIKLMGSPRKRAKLFKDDKIHSNDENNSDPAKSNFQPDFELIVSWL